MLILERVPFVPKAEMLVKGLEVELLRRNVKRNLEVILDEQHPQSNFFPAATKARYVGHYDDTWVRDNAMVGMSLFDSVVRSVYPKGTELGDRIHYAGVRLVGSMIELFGNEPWSSAFEQEVREVQDDHGRTYRKLDKPAPPIHFKINGENCDWPTQNQPDSWG